MEFESMNTRQESLLDPIGSLEALDQQRRAFSQLKTELLSRYLQSERSEKKNSTLLILNGWGDYSDLFLETMNGAKLGSAGFNSAKLATRSIAPLVNKKHDISLEGGYFFHLNGNGIVLNPGPGFLARFHSEGRHLWDIHHVIVTNSSPLTSHDIYEIYSLNKELNAQLRSYELPPHVIRFYLHPDAFKTYAPLLKPSLRQERGSVTALEIFQDSQGVEELALSDSVTLAYCNSNHDIHHSLSIKLITLEGDRQIRIGYASQSEATPDISSFLSDCDVVIVGVGDVQFEEIAKMQKRQECPGYVGTCEIIKELQKAKLVIISEQSMLEGDIRLELVRQIRIDTASKANAIPSIFPSEIGIEVELEASTLSTPFGLSNTPLDQVRVVRTRGQFSRLAFINQSSIL